MMRDKVADREELLRPLLVSLPRFQVGGRRNLSNTGIYKRKLAAQSVQAVVYGSSNPWIVVQC